MREGWAQRRKDAHELWVRSKAVRCEAKASLRANDYDRLGRCGARGVPIDRGVEVGF